ARDDGVLVRVDGRELAALARSTLDDEAVALGPQAHGVAREVAHEVGRDARGHEGRPGFLDLDVANAVAHRHVEVGPDQLEDVVSRDEAHVLDRRTRALHGNDARDDVQRFTESLAIAENLHAWTGGRTGAVRTVFWMNKRRESLTVSVEERRER